MSQARSVRIASAALLGVEGLPVEIEVSERNGHGPPRVLGLADAAVRESLHRIRSAFDEGGIPFPRGQLVVNLAPAHARKEGTGFDLPLALALAALSGLLPPARLRCCVALAELALDGRLRSARGAVPAAVMARSRGFDWFLCAPDDAQVLVSIPGIEVRTARDLLEAVQVLRGERDGAVAAGVPLPLAEGEEPALAEVRGQETARRALLAAATGGHNLLLSGPPGCGKTFLAARLPPLLPRLGEAEATDVLRIHSAFGSPAPPLLHGRPPFRAPHHTTSYAGLVGGGSQVRPGEITLAHHGVLFLDELPEFRRDALEAMRQPLEEGQIQIARARDTVCLPARFLLVAAMNPCPCGFLGHPTRACRCSPYAQRSYRARISGPLLDRIDLQVEMEPPATRDLVAAGDTAGSAAGDRARVAAARARQLQRNAGRVNARIGDRALGRLCALDRACTQYLEQALASFPLSARAVGRVRRVARTLADLAGRERIACEDLAEAVQLRAFDLSAG